MSMRQIFQHFGHTETFKIYDVEEGKVAHSEVVDTNGSGHGALSGVLKALNADVLICGEVGIPLFFGQAAEVAHSLLAVQFEEPETAVVVLDVHHLPSVGLFAAGLAVRASPRCV